MCTILHVLPLDKTHYVIHSLVFGAHLECGILINGKQGTQLFDPDNYNNSLKYYLGFQSTYLYGPKAVKMNDFVYFAGTDASMVVYNIRKNTTRNTPPMNIKRYYFCMTAIVSRDIIIVCGGQDKNGIPYSSCEQFANGSWSVIVYQR
jgi:hypothetical protein